MGTYKVIFRSDIHKSNPTFPITWERGCPLLVEAIQVSRETEAGDAYLQVRVNNLTTETVDSFSARFTLHFLDGESSVTKINPLDADIAPAGSYEVSPIYLSRGDILGVEGCIESANGCQIQWTSSNAPAELPTQTNLELSEAAKRERLLQLSNRGCRSPEYVVNHPVEQHETWIHCACGQLNVDSTSCIACGLTFEDSAAIEDENALLALAEKREEAAAQEREEKLARKEEVKIKARRIGIRAAIACAGVGIAFGIYALVIAPELEYQKAVDLLAANQYAGAVSAFASLGDYKDSQEQLEKAQDLEGQRQREEGYTQALESYNQGRYNDALDIFETLKHYKDSDYWSGKCLVELEQPDKAAESFEAVASESEFYEDARESAEACHYDLATQLLAVGKIAAAEQELEAAREFGNTGELLPVVSSQVSTGFAGIYQSTEEEDRYLLLVCMIDPATLGVSYEAYFQDQMAEESYSDIKLQDDGTLLVTNTFDGAQVTSNRDKCFIEDAKKQFQPDISVYSPSGGIRGYGPSGISQERVTLSVSGDTLTRSYHYIGNEWLSKEPFDRSGENQYKRIAETE